MGKSLILVLAAIASIVRPESSQAQSSPSIKIAVVLSEEQPVFRATLEGFRAQLVHQGYAPVIHTYTPANASSATSSGAALMFALGSAGAATATQLASLPTVFAVVGDPAGLDLMDASHLPKKGSTGVAALAPPRAQLLLIRAIVPDAKRIGVVIGKTHSTLLVKELEGEAAALGLKLVLIQPAGANTVGVQLAAHESEVDAILALADASIWTGASVKAAVIHSIQKKKPLFGFSNAFTRAGAIASISAEDYADMGAQAADCAIAILKGTPIKTLHIQDPRTLSTSINLVVARRMGIEPSREVVDHAEAVFR